MSTDDIPPPPTSRKHPLKSYQSYPETERYTLQHLSLVGKYATDDYTEWTPNNADAAFITVTEHPRPSALLLHYRYAVNALRSWGQNIDKLSELPRFVVQHSKAQVPRSSKKRPSDASDERLSAKRKHSSEPSKRSDHAEGASTEVKDPMDLLLEIPHLRQNVLGAQATRQEKLRSNVLDWQRDAANSRRDD